MHGEPHRAFFMVQSYCRESNEILKVYVDSKTATNRLISNCENQFFDPMVEHFLGGAPNKYE